jgi:hypothetical protein
MKWWEYVLVYASGIVGAAVFGALVLGVRKGVMTFLWRFLPNGEIKRLLFKEIDRTGIPQGEPWEPDRRIKAPHFHSRDLPPPADFIEAECVRTPRAERDDRQ